jgi:phosphatidylserine/phosphatidylglycerophosphate/cardiolipin synthase-like enzyme
MRVSARVIARIKRHVTDAAGSFCRVRRCGSGLLLPEEDCAAFAIRAIDNAEREILVSAYGLTTGSGIVEALARAKGRGVDVRLIADRATPCGRKSGVSMLANAGVPIWIDDQARIAHEKAMVIDEAVVLTGSYNWTRGAAENSEDLNLISSPTVATAYASH